MIWRLKIFFKIILSRLPIKYSYWKKIKIFKHGSMDSFDYPINVFQSHIQHLSKIRELKNSLIIEIGPGDSLATALLASCFGIKSVLIDVGNYANKDINFYKKFSTYLATKEMYTVDISLLNNVEEMLEVCDSKYLTKGIESIKQIADESVDLIFSQAVLEHIRKSEFSEYFSEFYRVLKASRISNHQIDLRDHLSGALNNLRFSDRLWESNFFAKSGFYTNRIGYDEIYKIALNNGFKVKTNNILKWDEIPTKKEYFSYEFKSRNDESLKIKVFDLYLEK